MLTIDEDIARDTTQRIDTGRIIYRNANHLLTIIDDILDMSKIESGKLTVEQIETSPIQIMEEVASIAQFKAKSKRIDVVVKYATPIPEQNKDPRRKRRGICSKQCILAILVQFAI
ncbi:MAG: hypothetical protein ABGX16_15600 [Pirellulales bacterium]